MARPRKVLVPIRKVIGRMETCSGRIGLVFERSDSYRGEAPWSALPDTMSQVRSTIAIEWLAIVSARLTTDIEQLAVVSERISIGLA